jgi:hypothetical protein
MNWGSTNEKEKFGDSSIERDTKRKNETEER